MANEFNKIFIDDVQVHPDRAHGIFPVHVDVRTRLEPGLCEKIRVDPVGNILDNPDISRGIEPGRSWLKPR